MTWWSSPKATSMRGSPSIPNSARSMRGWRAHRLEVGECPFILWSYLAEREPAPGRQVVEERPASAGTLRLEMVKCGKARCKKCERGEGHGPYWYLSFRRNGKLTSRYIGKT